MIRCAQRTFNRLRTVPTSQIDAASLPPEEILHHLEALTRHRDSVLLKSSVMRSLLNLLGAKRVRLFDLFKKNDSFNLALSSWSELDTIRSLQDLPRESEMESIESNPVFALCLRLEQFVSNIDSDGDYLACLPLMLGGKPIAILELTRATPFEQHDLDVLSGVTAVFMNYLSLLEDSQQDTLTGLLNRKTFDHGFAALLASLHPNPRDQERRTVQGEKHWLAVIDIDHFKRVNDQFGHLYGDEVLLLMANLMRNSFRKQDRLYRFGGEEFVVLMRGVGYEGARHKLEQFRQNVEQQTFPQVGKVTVSVGFAPIHESDTPNAVLGNADDALYYAKEHGRNQIQCHTTLVEQNLLATKSLNTCVELF